MVCCRWSGASRVQSGQEVVSCSCAKSHWNSVGPSGRSSLHWLRQRGDCPTIWVCGLLFVIVVVVVIVVACHSGSGIASGSDSSSETGGSSCGIKFSALTVTTRRLFICLSMQPFVLSVCLLCFLANNLVSYSRLLARNLEQCIWVSRCSSNVHLGAVVVFVRCSRGSCVILRCQCYVLWWTLYRQAVIRIVLACGLRRLSVLLHPWLATKPYYWQYAGLTELRLYNYHLLFIIKELILQWSADLTAGLRQSKLLMFTKCSYFQLLS